MIGPLAPRDINVQRLAPVAAVAFACGCAGVDPGVPVDAIVNSGFEAGLQGWTVAPEPAAAELSADANEGERSVRLNRKAAYVMQRVTVRPNTIYRLTASANGPGNLGVKVATEIFFEQNAADRWRTVAVTFETGSATEVALFATAAGDQALFDGLRLFEVPEPSVALSPRLRSSSSGGYGLSPDLPPGRNFELIDWYLSIPADDNRDGKSDRVTEAQLTAGYVEERYFWTADDGGMVFRATIAGARTSKNTKYTRTELREMLRRGDTSIRTRLDSGRPNKNNWVFSSAPLGAQRAAGGVDGKLRATLAVNQVTTTGNASQVGRVIIGQIHAKDDEPARLYYRKLPQHTKGSLYVAHEPSGGDDVFYELIGTRANDGPEPPNGIALGEVFSYEIDARGHQLAVRVYQGDAKLAEAVIDMTTSGYDVEDDYMYFKAGVYNQNNSGDPADFDQATFYELRNSHDPVPE